jgi:hypothetical protein
VSLVSSRGAIWLPLTVQPASRQRCRSSISLPTATVGHMVLSSAQIRHPANTATTTLIEPAYQDAFIGMIHRVQVALPIGTPDSLAWPSPEPRLKHQYSGRHRYVSGPSALPAEGPHVMLWVWSQTPSPGESQPA